MAWINCCNCGRSFQENALQEKKSKHSFSGATQYQAKCPYCHVAIKTSVVVDEADHGKRVNPAELGADVIGIMGEGRYTVAEAKKLATERSKGKK